MKHVNKKVGESSMSLSVKSGSSKSRYESKKKVIDIDNEEIDLNFLIISELKR